MRILLYRKNALTGNVPPEIKDLERLHTISLDSNLMAGELQMLGDLSELGEFLLPCIFSVQLFF